MPTLAEQYASFQQQQDAYNQSQNTPATASNTLGAIGSGIMQGLAENTKVGKVFIAPFIETDNNKKQKLASSFAQLKMAHEAEQIKNELDSAPLRKQEEQARLQGNINNAKAADATRPSDTARKLSENQASIAQHNSAVIDHSQKTALGNLLNDLNTVPGFTQLNDQQKQSILSLGDVKNKLDLDTAGRLYHLAKQSGDNRSALDAFLMNKKISIERGDDDKEYISHPDVQASLEFNHFNAVKVFNAGNAEAVKQIAAKVKMFEMENIGAGRADLRNIEKSMPLFTTTTKNDDGEDTPHAKPAEALKFFNTFKENYTKTNPAAYRLHLVASIGNEFLNGNSTPEQKAMDGQMLFQLVKQTGLAKDVKPNPDGTFNIVLPDNSELPAKDYIKKLEAVDTFANDYNQHLAAAGIQKKQAESNIIENTFNQLADKDKTKDLSGVPTEQRKAYVETHKIALNAAQQEYVQNGSAVAAKKVYTTIMQNAKIPENYIINPFGAEPEKEQLGQAEAALNAERAKTKDIVKNTPKGTPAAIAVTPASQSVFATPAIDTSFLAPTTIGTGSKYSKHSSKLAELAAERNRIKAEVDKQTQQQDPATNQEKERRAAQFRKLFK